MSPKSLDNHSQESDCCPTCHAAQNNNDRSHGYKTITHQMKSGHLNGHAES